MFQLQNSHFSEVKPKVLVFKLSLMQLLCLISDCHIDNLQVLQSWGFFSHFSRGQVKLQSKDLQVRKPALVFNH